MSRAPGIEAPRSPPSRAGLLALASVLALVTAAKLAIVFAGADYDGDAYAHAMAGRRMLQDPLDVTIHWVWLPLVHALHAAATSAGSGIQAVRVLNALASSASPIVLFFLLQPPAHAAPTPPKSPSKRAKSDTTTRPAAPSLSASTAVPWLAASLLAADPLCAWLGVTGQTEPLFQLSLLGALLAHERRSFTLAGALFAAASLTRYEAWPLLPVLFWLALRTSRPPTSPEPTRKVQQKGAMLRLSQSHPRVAHALETLHLRVTSPERRSHLLWLLPAIAITSWCLFHFQRTGEPLQFLRLNREFASGYLAGAGYPWGKQPIWPLMLVFYVTVIPVWNMLGLAFLLAPLGLRRALRELPRAFTVTSLALVAIVTWGFLRGTHLGLPRHAVAFAPFYCALVAHGACALVERFTRSSTTAPEPGSRPTSGAAPRASSSSTPSAHAAPSALSRPQLLVPLVLLAFVVASRTTPKLVELWHVTERAFVAESAAARALRELSTPGEPIFCDDGKIEVLSQLAPARFTRWQITDVTPFHISVAASRHGSALVISTSARTAHLPGGTTLWTDGTLVLQRYDSAAVALASR